MRTTLQLTVWDDWFELWAGEEILLDGNIVEGCLLIAPEWLAKMLRKLNYGVVVKGGEEGSGERP